MNFKKIYKPVGRKMILFTGLFFMIGLIFSERPKKTQRLQPSTIKADSAKVLEHLKALVQTPQFRNYKNTEQLNAIAEYIHRNFEQYSDSTDFQEYKVDGRTYKNVICSFGTEHTKRIIVGAHYDVCGDQQGADDNATGVTAILELARMLKDEKLNYRIDLVAYTLEEPPYFRTEKMGSYVHAKYLKDNKIDVYGMLSVEMIGYFSDEEHSQSFPVGFLSKVYGNKGDFITLVKKFGAGKFVRHFSSNFKASKAVKTETFAAPKFVSGVDFSDHLNYWKFGYSAVMITDTSFFRNKNYHEPTDTLETLDLLRMTKVIDGIFLSLIHLK